MPEFPQWLNWVSLVSDEVMISKYDFKRENILDIIIRPVDGSTPEVSEISQETVRTKSLN